MIFSPDEQNTNSIKPTDFDSARMESLNIGDKMDNEYGTWSLIRYESSWVLLLQNNPKYGSFLEFNTMYELVEFLNKA